MLWVYNKKSNPMTKKFHTQLAKVKSKNSFRGMFELEFADKKKDGVPSVVHLIPIGQWEHDAYGPIIINNADIREYAQNFNAGVRKGVFITAGHEGFQELPAVGWIMSVEARDTGLWGTVEWTPEGIKLLSDKAFKFFSPEMCRDYEDPETHQFYRNVMTGGALTKSPYFKELESIVFSEKGAKINSNNFNDKTMNLQELLAKDITTLTDEEKAFIKSNAAELTDEQKATHTSIIDEPAGDDKEETAEEKNAREHKEADEKAAKEKADTEAANIAAGLNADGTPKEDAGAGAGKEGEDIKASEKNVTISASELAALRKKADEGAQAFAELETAKLNTAVNALMFTESNKTGSFLPKGKDAVLAFMKTLNPAQRLAFNDVLKHVVKDVSKFKEEGDGGTEGGTSQAELENKVKVKMSENPKLKYSEALKMVLSENKGLEERYDKELPSARKKTA